MQAYSFETFEVTDANRHAFELCQAISGLEYRSSHTVLLLGPRGAGKTHLLWSVVQAVRAGTAKAGLALVLADEFPDKVRQLVDNPAPIQTGKPAILLVDELEEFRGKHAKELEAVVETFLENRHTVVLASNVSPDRLPHLSDGFKALLGTGSVMPIKPRATVAAATPDAPADGAGQTLEAECEALRTELATARHGLEETERLKQRLQAVEQEKATLHEQLSRMAAAQEAASATSETAEQTQDRLAQLETELAGQCEKNQALEARIETLTAEAEQVAQLREEAARLERERDAAQADAARLEKHAQDMLDAIQSQLAELDALESGDLASLDDVLHGLSRRVAAANEAEREALESERDEARALADAYRAQLEQTRQDLESETGELQRENEHLGELLEESRSEQGRLSVALESARGRLKALEFELQKTRRQLALQAAEMDALRQEAASQVASANVQAGEMENRIQQLQAALEYAQDTGRTMRGGAQHLAESLHGLAQQAAQLGAQETFLHLPARTPEQEEDGGGVVQTSFFEVDDLEVLPSGAEPAPPEPASSEDTAARFREMVEEALSLDDEGEEA